MIVQGVFGKTPIAGEATNFHGLLKRIRNPPPKNVWFSSCALYTALFLVPLVFLLRVQSLHDDTYVEEFPARVATADSGAASTSPGFDLSLPIFDLDLISLPRIQIDTIDFHMSHRFWGRPEVRRGHTAPFARRQLL